MGVFNHVRSWFGSLNKKTLSLLGLIVIVIILPIALFLATNPHVLRQKASETNVLQFVNVAGNALPETVTDETVYLTIRLPNNWQIEGLSSNLFAQKAWAQSCSDFYVPNNPNGCGQTTYPNCTFECVENKATYFCRAPSPYQNACAGRVFCDREDYKCASNTAPAPVALTCETSCSKCPTRDTLGYTTYDTCNDNLGQSGGNLCKNNATSFTCHARDNSQCSSVESYSCPVDSEEEEEPTEAPRPTARPTNAPEAPPGVRTLRALTIENIDGGSGGEYLQITSDFGNWIGPDKKIRFRLNPLESSEQEAVRAVKVTFSDGQIEEPHVSTINLARPAQAPPACVAVREYNECIDCNISRQVAEDSCGNYTTLVESQEDFGCDWMCVEEPGEPASPVSNPIIPNRYGMQIDTNDPGVRGQPDRHYEALNPGWIRYVYRLYNRNYRNLLYRPSYVKTLLIFNHESVESEIPPPLGQEDFDVWKTYIDEAYLPELQAMLERESGIQAIEVWNEEDRCFQGSYCPYVAPEAYAYMLQEAAAIIKDYNSSIRVVMGGLDSKATATSYIGEMNMYIQRMRDAYPDTFANVDALSLYPYGTSPNGWCATRVSGCAVGLGVGDLGNIIDRARQVSGLPIWVTEIGQGTNDSEWQAAYLERVFNVLTSKGVPVIIWYAWNNTLAGGDGQANWGLFANDEIKSSGIKFAEFTHEVVDSGRRSLTGASTTLQGDINGDGKVDKQDYDILVSQFGQKGPNLSADLDKDGDVDIFDHKILAENYGKTSQ